MKHHALSSEHGHAAHFSDFLCKLTERFHPHQIHSFSRNIHSKSLLGCFKDNEDCFLCNYCLLIVTTDEKHKEHEFQDFANINYQYGSIIIICQQKDYIIKAIKANNRFFINIYIHGNLLYIQSGNANVDPTPVYIPINAVEKAIKVLNHRKELAESFLLSASACLLKEHYTSSIFMLHQVTEQTCIALIKIHTGYLAEFHNLHRLLRLCECFSEKPYHFFLSNAEDERLFGILLKSYSATRYNENFTVTKEDSEHLYKRVNIFLLLAVDMCNKKIEQLKIQADHHCQIISEAQ